MEGLIFGGAYVWREICVLKSIGLALFLERNLLLFFFLLCTIQNNFQVQAPPGGDLYLEGRFNGRFFALRIRGAYIWRGLYMEGLIFGILRYIIFLSKRKTIKTDKFVLVRYFGNHDHLCHHSISL